ncbi:MAG: membrane dipeptidase [Deltaproteobacteria bacterium]|nr:membrane dipeptidase [Deltaproteobacteria bacterium]
MTATARPAEEVTEQAQALHRRSIVVDGCSFFLRGYNDRIAAGGLTAINFTVPDVYADAPAAFAAVREYYEVARRDPKVEIARTVADIERCKVEGKLAAILGTQNSRFLGTELALVEMFARLGVRVVQLTYNERNFAGDGWMEPVDAGLSFYGRSLIKELARCGIVLDLAHIGQRTIMEAIEASEQPVVVTHAGIRKFVDHPRTVSDEQMKAIAATGGVVGVTSFGSFNWRGGRQRPRLADFLEAIEHAIGVAGIDHVGIGTDSVVEPGGYPQKVRDHSAMTYGPYSEKQIAHTRGFKEATAGFTTDEHLEGFRSMEHLPRVTQGLLDRGYREEDVRKVLGANFLRVFQAVWKPLAA